MENWIVGCDVGGTFTDFCAREITTGRTVIHKRPSTPEDPSRAVLNGLRELAELHSIDPASIERFAHGTTVATNALLQRRGAKVAVITTRGFRDLLEIGRQARPLIYDLQADSPAPLAGRQHRFEIEERIGPKGEIIRPLTDEAIAAVIDQIRAQPEIEAVAICLIFSFINPEHERRIADAISTALPHVFVSVSSEVQPEFREFERFSTALINAFLQPEVSRYMARLESEVKTVAPEAEFGIFQSSGGLMNVGRAREFPVRTALSGPAAGAVGAAGSGTSSGIGGVITLDIGGTSTDVCLIREGKTGMANTRDISGFRIRLPMVDIHTVGAGGGSIAQIGADGLMKVGPESAGAVPGPACYAKGGTLPTVSDANVILGRLPIQLAGGGLTIDRDLAVRAVTPIAQKLGISIEEAALGIIDIATANMTRAIRVVSIERGYDPRKFTLMPFGGAGGLHAADVAKSLGMTRIIVPRAPGILCAEGLILADLQEDFVANCRGIVAEDQMDKLRAEFDGLLEKAREWLAQEAQDAAAQSITLGFDMRYFGQNYELAVEVASGADTVACPDAATLKEAFLAEYRRNYGHCDPEGTVETVNVRLRVTAQLAQGEANGAPPAGTPEPADHVRVWFDKSGPLDTPIYARGTLPSGTAIAGPAIITQLDSTTVVPPDAEIRVDHALNMIMELANG
ncbi:N-methylhydantoinase A [Paracoccus aminovorans]|uniref:N-methylhydantoinase A n=1 Tax=Paracoccus aminovorans TaxID=34004 RepID=A0A1I3B4N5_9RHOB|nr:hydantoinase/oxoprolinase family protein [Paracoccus aminovorans]CQR87577.1 N-methylhydantoinase (ATP-hydrolyzing) A [Paracoccus aminovorans]SFH56671.1 N-methylhydantoinase A [Paracoccus aminovorans]